MIRLGLGMSIARNDAANAVTPPGVTATMEAIGEPTIIPNTTAGEYQVVLSEPREVDTPFEIHLNDWTGFEILINPIIVPAGLLTANGSIGSFGGNLVNPVIVSLTNPDVEVLNSLSFELIE